MSKHKNSTTSFRETLQAMENAKVDREKDSEVMINRLDLLNVKVAIARLEGMVKSILDGIEKLLSEIKRE